MAKPRLSSLRQNQRATATLEASTRASAPEPTMRRPAAITARRGLRAVTTRPTKTITLKMAIDFRVPSRSMTQPQTSIATMLGRL